MDGSFNRMGEVADNIVIRNIFLFVLMFTLPPEVKCERFCYVCSGIPCLHNPHNPDLYPGRIKCHPVLEYCSAHIRYVPKNESLGPYAVGQPYDSNKPLSPKDYSPMSATRSCAKVWLGNLCRRDWLGKPEITCITTCDSDFCNCGSRSPPEMMFKAGKVLAEAPKNSKYSANDVTSCRAMAGVPGYDDGGERITKDQYPGPKRPNKYNKRRGRYRNTGSSPVLAISLMALTLSVTEIGFYLEM